MWSLWKKTALLLVQFKLAELKTCLDFFGIVPSQTLSKDIEDLVFPYIVLGVENLSSPYREGVKVLCWLVLPVLVLEIFVKKNILKQKSFRRLSIMILPGVGLLGTLINSFCVIRFFDLMPTLTKVNIHESIN